MQLKLQDWTLHSLPFAYATFDIASSDGDPHAVQLYTDTSIRECLLTIMHPWILPLTLESELASSNDTNVVTWNTSLTAKSIYHMAQQMSAQTLVENGDMAEDGSQILAYTAVFNFADYLDAG
jgi:hypothetical protein